MNKSVFLQQAKAQFLDIFQKSKAKTNVMVEKHRAEGFLYAGELLGLTDKTELQQLMADAHLEVFGYALSERLDYQQQRKAALADEQFQYFDEPAISRRREHRGWFKKNPLTPSANAKKIGATGANLLN